MKIMIPLAQILVETMRLIRDLNNLPKLPRTVVTIGSFDGLHLGHQKILSKVKQLSKENNCDNLVITFHPHPRSVIFPNDKSLKLLTTLEEKISLFEELGIDNLVIVPFTKAFSHQTAQAYIEDFLLSFSPSHIVIGYDHKFGADRAGNIGLLRDLSKQNDYLVHEITKQEIKDITISSTQIRNSISSGNVSTANSLLARPYSLTGTVVKGKQLGKELGYPTANLQVDNDLKLIPSDGIYTCRILVNSECYEGMLYIGTNPTIDNESTRAIEVNVFDFDQDIYGQTITLQLLSFLRSDKKFSSLEALKVQLNEDKKESLEYFRNINSKNEALTTIAILNYNSQDFLESFLPSVSFSSQSNFETILIDNDSSDDSIVTLQEWFPEIEIVRLNANYGFAEGYNRGLKDVKSKYVAFLNSDVEVSEGWLDPLTNYLDANDDRESFEYAGAAGGYIDTLAYPFCRGRVFDKVEKDKGQYNSVEAIAWVSGAAFVIRRELFEKLDGFDGSYFAHQEEIDLCWRLRRAGYKLMAIPDSVVYHVGGGTLNYGSSRKIFLNFRNSLATLFKNEPVSALIWKLPLRLILDGLAGIKFLVDLQPRSFLAVIKAHFAFYGRLPKLISQKKDSNTAIEAIRIGSPRKDGYYPQSIVAQYFLKGKKTFSELLNL